MRVNKWNLPVIKAAIEAALSATQGNVSKAARMLGYSREHLHRLLARLEIKVENYR